MFVKWAVDITVLLFFVGHYYYIEASGKKEGDKARLISLSIRAKEGGKCSLRFYYHMFGKDVKDLNVYALTKSGQLNPVFKASGDLGDVWQFANVDLSTRYDPFKLVFEGKNCY